MHCSFDSPIFVVGASRSGTTLVYSILLSSGEFPIYEAETLLIEECSLKYGNLRNKKNFQRFMNDWLKSKQFLRSGLDPKEFSNEAKFHCNDYTDFLRFFMESMAKSQGKKRWVEKTPSNIRHMKRLLLSFPGAKFIHVIRDGRDVAISRRKLGWTTSITNDPLTKLLFAALDWEKTVKYGRDCGDRLGKNYMEIRYEDLICNLDKELNRLNDFVSINIDKQKIENCSIGSLKKINTAFRNNINNTKKISDNPLFRWKRELSKDELNLLNLNIGETLLQLGYEVDLEKIQGSNLLKKIKIKKNFCLLLIFMGRFLKHKMLLGRLSPSGLEINKS